MNALISALVHRPRPVILVLIVLLIAGGSTYVSIPKEAEPDIPIPQIYINIAHEGISPEEAGICEVGKGFPSVAKNCGYPP